jgi:hypothetical protein
MVSGAVIGAGIFIAGMFVGALAVLLGMWAYDATHKRL